MKTIFTKKGEEILVDDDVYLWASQFKWRISNERGYKYAIAAKCKLHRIIMQTMNEPKLFIDHINGNGLDNRRENLRVCTLSENLLNQKRHKNNTTGYKGVYRNKNTGKYMAFCAGDGVRKISKYFVEDYKAALAYNDIALKLHGEFARLNELKDVDMIKMIMTGQTDELDRHLKMCQSDKTIDDILQKYQE